MCTRFQNPKDIKLSEITQNSQEFKTNSVVVLWQPKRPICSKIQQQTGPFFWPLNFKRLFHGWKLNTCEVWVLAAFSMIWELFRIPTSQHKRRNPFKMGIFMGFNLAFSMDDCYLPTYFWIKKYLSYKENWVVKCRSSRSRRAWIYISISMYTHFLQP